MVIAALICFAILLVAWILAPDGRTEPVRVTEPEGDALPVAA
jgi:hypothetical protein